MKPYTPHYGSSQFLEFVEKRYLMVDKTLFVKSFMEGRASVSLITRPRRWGKTFNLSILDAFFSIPVDSQGKIDFEAIEKKRLLFSQFKIGQETDVMKEHLGQYPVVLITFKEVKGEDLEKNFSGLRLALRDTYRSHSYLLQSPRLSLDEKKVIKEFISSKISESTLPFGLKLLMEFLTTHFEGRRCILLIDEYDTPFNLLFSQKILRAKQSLISETEKEEFRTQEAHLKKLLGFFQTLLGSSLKGTEKFMEKAVVTGILRIAKANLFSSVNNLGEFGILEARPNSAFVQDFGFLLEEVAELLDQNGSTESNSGKSREEWLEEVQAWYNGYTLGRKTFYNPWSVMSWLANDKDFGLYWVQTASESLLKTALLDRFSPDQMKRLLSKEWSFVPMRQQVELADFSDPTQQEALVWTLLCTSGYLTVRSQERGSYEVKIPNREVLEQFQDLCRGAVSSLFSGSANTQKDLPAVAWMRSLEQGNIQSFCEGLKKGLAHEASFYHATKRPQGFAETFYHGLVLGLFLVLQDHFDVHSEIESGDGRLDLLILGKPGTAGASWGYLFEFKAGGDLTVLKKEVQTAVRQIRKKDYGRKLDSLPKTQKIYEVAMAFSGKHLEYAYRLRGTTDEDDIREWAGEYYRENWDEMIQAMSRGVQEAVQQVDFDRAQDLSGRLKKLQQMGLLGAKGHQAGG